jgi:hypothetical protein
MPASLPAMRRAGRQREFKPHLREYWVIPPEANAAFVAAMEDVLDVYHRPPDPDRPLVCLDESSKQLVAETRTPLPMEPGQPARHDYEYERNGTANLFMLFAPLEGWREVKVTGRRTAARLCPSVEGARRRALRQGEQDRAGAGQSQHPHQGRALHEAFPPEEARRLVERFEGTIRPSTAAG